MEIIDIGIIDIEVVEIGIIDIEILNTVIVDIEIVEIDLDEVTRKNPRGITPPSHLSSARRRICSWMDSSIVRTITRLSGRVMRISMVWFVVLLLPTIS